MFLSAIQPYCICAFTVVYVSSDVSLKIRFEVSWWLKNLLIKSMYVIIFFELDIINPYVLTPIALKDAYWTTETNKTMTEKKSRKLVRKRTGCFNDSIRKNRGKWLTSWLWII